jgi:LDH2 family malate/lactate/ureidoglycolate dehydrogenase
MDAYIQELKATPKLPGQDRIYIHGEKEFALTENYEKEGVPLLKEIVASLQETGKEIGIPFDLKPVG